MILPDYPIQSEDSDKLKRAPLAQKVADLVLSFKGSESFVVGIESAWGAEKTSFINMVLETLGNEVCRWNFSDQTSLLKDFFSSFSNIEPIISRKDLKNKLTGYAKKLSDYGFQSINLSVIFFNPLQKLLNESLSDIRDSLNKSLGSLEKKVVIVIDDIDGLNAGEKIGF
jgi:predicted KAP-like P-loop ATPase